jgi:prefoldin subunit 5
MRRFYIFTLALIFSTSLLNGQTMDDLDTKLDSLNLIIEKVDLQINELNNLKTQIRQQISELNQKKTN